METAVRRRAAATGEIQPDLSRRLYSVCCHHSLEILGLWALPTDFSVSGGDIFERKPYGASLKREAEKEKQSYSLDRHSLFCGSRNFLDDLVLFLHSAGGGRACRGISCTFADRGARHRVRYHRRGRDVGRGEALPCHGGQKGPRRCRGSAPAAQCGKGLELLQ